MKISSIRGGITGDIAYDGTKIVRDDEPQATGKPEGFVDRENGEIYLNIPGLAEYHISGLPTLDSIGKGRQGERGKLGKTGTTGKIMSQGDKGDIGERGDKGVQGRDGNDGYRGYKGDMGEDGDVGDKGYVGGAGQIPYFIQSEDPGNVGAGGVWVKRMGIVEREDINRFAPRIMIEDLTIFRKEERKHAITVVTDGIPLQRVNLSTKDDDIVELSYALQPNDNVVVTANNIKVPDTDDVWTTEVELFVENSVGSAKETFTLTVLDEEEPNVK